MSTTQFETGATSEAVNELILYTDTTKELAELRDSIYKRAFAPNDIISAQFSVNGYTQGICALHRAFGRLLIISQQRYRKEFPTTTWDNIPYWEDQGQEFCQIYTNYFATWKKENGYE